jgi:hypothetical protein
MLNACPLGDGKPAAFTETMPIIRVSVEMNVYQLYTTGDWPIPLSKKANSHIRLFVESATPRLIRSMLSRRTIR